LNWKLKYSVGYIFSVFTFLELSGQPADLHFKHYAYPEGLTAPVRKIQQDLTGFIWIGTEDGLNRFDGKSFTVYRNSPADTNSLTNNIVNDLNTDSQGRVWVATNGGLCYFSYRDHRFHRITLPDNLEPDDRYRIHGVASNAEGEIWFATKNKIHLLDSSLQIHSSHQLPGDKNVFIRDLFTDRKSQVWVGANYNGIFLFDSESGTFKKGSPHSTYAGIQNLTITTNPMTRLAGDTLLAGTWYGGLQLLFPWQDHIMSREIPNPLEADHKKNIITAVCRWKDDLWWIGSHGCGLFLFDAKRKIFVRQYRHQAGEARSLGNDFVGDVFVDRQGIVWIGTEGGLDQYDEKSEQFSLVAIRTKPGETSVARLPRAIVEDPSLPDSYWVAVPGIGLLRFKHEGRLVEQPLPSWAARLPDKNVYCIFYENPASLLIGTLTGVFRVYPGLDQIKAVSFPGNQVPVGVNHILRDKKQRLWFSTFSNGVFCFDSLSGQLKHFSQNPDQGPALPDNKIFCLLEDHAGNIWAGTQNRGLCRIRADLADILTLEYRQYKNHGLPDNNIYDLYEDGEKRLWVATENGLACIQPGGQPIQSFDMRDGLSNHVIYSITPDKAGHLWLATNNGLCDFDTRSYKSKNHFIRMGLPNNRINGASLAARNGYLFFTTGSHILVCDPGKLEFSGSLPPTVVTGIRVFENSYPFIQNTTGIGPIRLTYRQNNIGFEFTTLNFTNPESNQFAYKMEGLTEEWVNCGSRQMIGFTNLSGGHYLFQARAIHADGKWTESLPVLIYIAPPFWLRAWFIGLVLTVLGCAAYGIMRFRINQLIRLQKIRLNIARDLHDDIGSTLSSIHMVSTMSEEKQKGRPEANAFATISKASQQAMELMNEIVWSINPKNDTLDMMLIHMRQFTSEILEPLNIHCHFIQPEACNSLVIPLEKRKDFYLIFKEAINNIAKYSGATKVTVELACHLKSLSLTITDNGRGFDPLGKHKGNGLKNMEARARMIGGQLEIDTGPGKGTRTQLAFPLVP